MSTFVGQNHEYYDAMLTYEATPVCGKVCAVHYISPQASVRSEKRNIT